LDRVCAFPGVDKSWSTQHAGASMIDPMDYSNMADHIDLVPQMHRPRR
jgi:hypothetical protein